MSKPEDPLPSSAGLGDILSGIFQSGERLIDTSDVPSDPYPSGEQTNERDRERLEKYYMEQFLKRYIPRELVRSIHTEAEIVHENFPLWQMATLNAVHRSGGSSAEEVANIVSAITLPKCAVFAQEKFDALIKELGDIIPESQHYNNVANDARYWNRISSAAKAAAEFRGK